MQNLSPNLHFITCHTHTEGDYNGYIFHYYELFLHWVKVLESFISLTQKFEQIWLQKCKPLAGTDQPEFVQIFAPDLLGSVSRLVSLLIWAACT